MMIDDLVKELMQAQSCLDSASKEVQNARHKETAAINRLNTAQKALDKAISELRKNSPSQSDWGQHKEPHMGFS